MLRPQTARPSRPQGEPGQPSRPEDRPLGGAVSTDLERFLATDGRADAVERVRAEIDAKGITYI